MQKIKFYILQLQYLLSSIIAKLYLLQLLFITFKGKSLKQCIPHASVLKSSLVFILVFGVINTFATTYSNDLSFKQVSIENGLSQSSVFTIAEDHLGFVWLGTSDGLNMFDGYEFVIYKHKPSNKNSISSNYITCLLEDKNHNLWIGTKDAGLNLYDRNKQQFTRFFKNKDNYKGPGGANITYLYEAKNGNIWIGTKEGGLSEYDIKTQQFHTYKSIYNNINSIGSNNIKCINEDDNNNIWVSTEDAGLYILNVKTKIFKKVIINSTVGSIVSIIPNYKESKLLIANTGEILQINSESYEITYPFSSVSTVIKENDCEVVTASVDHSNSLWLGTDSKGIIIIDLKTGNFSHQMYSPEKTEGITSNFIKSIYPGNNGIVYVGTDGGGLQIFNEHSIKFENYKNNSFNNKSINDDDIWAINKYQDKILVGTSSGGLNILNPTTKEAVFLKHSKNNPNSLSNNFISAIIEDSLGNYWISTRGGGINIFNPKTQSFTTINHDAENSNSLSGDYIYTMYKTRNNNFWISVSNKGLNHYNPFTNKFKKYRHQPNNKKSIGSNGIVNIFEDSKGKIWLALEQNGLDCFDPLKEEFIHFTHDSKNNNSLRTNDVICVFEDSYNTIWIGTSSGLNAYIPSTKKFFFFDEPQGLPNGVIYCITEDRNKHLWFSTNKGICQFKIPPPDMLSNQPQQALNEIQVSLRTYDKSDGLVGNEFNINAFFKDEKGIFYFGGIAGLVSFHPDSLNDNVFTPPLYLTSFKIFDQEFPLDTTILQKKEIVLNYNQNYISFDFIALNYQNPQKIKYSYMLEGFDKNWIDVSKQRYAKYTNLEPGSYIFKVKVTNSNGVWADDYVYVRLVIKPPFWKQTWFYVISTLLVILLIRGIIFLRERKLTKDKEHLEHQVELRTQELTNAKEQAEKSAKAKETFLSTMSHEIRTPMNAILGMTHLLIEENKDTELDQNLKTLKFSADNLLGIINDILDFSKIDAGKVEFEESDFNLKELVIRIKNTFSLQTAEKNLILDFSIDSKIPDMLVGDQIRINQILTNLISNAIKFTQVGGIYVSINLKEITEKKAIIHFSIKDTGIGIKKEKQKIIFESFEQASNDTTRKYGGTGLGLAITKKLLELKNTQINIESKPGVGSTFFFDFEFGLSKKSKIKDNLNINNFKEDSFKDIKILLVEDNAINQLIASKFLYKWGAEINFAENGLKGVERVKSKKYDIILMDLQMPEMDGFEATKQIRALPDEYYQQVPIIALTATAVLEVRKQVLDAGMNDFIAKPFNPTQLYKQIAKYCNIKI